MRSLSTAASPRNLTLLALACIVLWDLAGLDLPLARLAGDVHGFPWRDHWLLANVLHKGARALGTIFAIALCVGVWWPIGPLKKISRARRAQIAVTAFVAAGAISLLKSWSAFSCPWDLQAFGGDVPYVPHWLGLAGDGGPGHCFPAGHASWGFAFVGGYFAFRETDSRIARAWLLGALAVGFALGWVQQLRGAHFMSHALWSAWICWVIAYAIDAACSFMPAPAGVVIRRR